MTITNNTRTIILFLFIFGALSLTTFGQDEEPIKTDTRLVNINVAITGKNSKFVEGLTKDNFEILDNGIGQKIETFSAEEAPVSYGIVYDMHPTTDEATKAVLESLREFTRGLRKQDDFFVTVFDKSGSLSLDFVPTAEQVNIHLRSNRKEPTALYDAMYASASKLRSRRNLKRVLLVITDSADHNSEHRFGEILDEFKTLDASFYAIMWDRADNWRYKDITIDGEPERRVLSDASSLERSALLQLALRTGGTVESPTVQNANELFKIYNEIAIQVNKQYAIGFYPQTVDGKWHDVRIGLRSVKNSKKMVLTYRLGYQSPKPE